MKIVNKNKSKFLKIVCPRCHQIQIVYGKSAIDKKCDKCNLLLIKTSGGKAKVKAKVTKVLWK